MPEYKQISTPTGLVITIEEAFKHLVLDITADADQVDFVTSLIKAATEYCEAYQRRCYLLTEWEAYLDKWPLFAILIEKTPVISISKIEYKDLNGVWQTLSEANYSVNLIKQPARVIFKNTLPIIDPEEFNNIRITFKSGYVNSLGAQDISLIPENVKSAIKLIIGHLYEHREQVTSGSSLTNMDFGVDTLLDINRIFRF